MKKTGRHGEMIQWVAGIVNRCIQQAPSARVSFETGRRTDVVILSAASVETAYQKHVSDFENFIQQVRSHESLDGEGP